MGLTTKKANEFSVGLLSNFNSSQIKMECRRRLCYCLQQLMRLMV